MNLTNLICDALCFAGVLQKHTVTDGVAYPPTSATLKREKQVQINQNFGDNYIVNNVNINVIYFNSSVDELHLDRSGNIDCYRRPEREIIDLKYRKGQLQNNVQKCLTA